MFRFCRNNPLPERKSYDSSGNLICDHLPKKDVVYSKPSQQMTQKQAVAWASKFKFR